MEKAAKNHRQIGVWIDHEKALIVTMVGELSEVRTLHGEIDSKHKSTGGTRSAQGYGHRSVESAKRHDLHRSGQIQKFFGLVVEAIDGADELVLMGPNEARHEFATFLTETKGNNAPRVKSSEALPSRLTEPQIVAFVRKAYGKSAPRKALNLAGVPTT